MTPTVIHQSNLTLRKPDSMTDEECGSLATIVDRDKGTFTSAWLPSKEELAALNAGSAVLLTVWSGRHPPVALAVSTEKYDAD